MKGHRVQMGGGIERAGALERGLGGAIRSGCSVALWGASGVELRAATEWVMGSTACLGFSTVDVLRVSVDPGARPGTRVEMLDAAFATSSEPGPRLVVVDEPDADLPFSVAIPIVDHMLSRAGEVGAALLFTTKRVGQAVAAEYAYRVSERGVRRIL